MFLKRNYNPELMDDFSIQDERIDKALNELKTTNKFLGGISTTYQGLRILLNGKQESRLSILDSGSGASDILLSLKLRFPFIKIVSLDLNKRVCMFLKNEPSLEIICGDILKVPVKEKSFDIIHSSLFLHHFNEEEIKIILKNFMRAAKTGIIINDLRRSVVALAGIKIIASLLSKSDLYKNDGPLSVKRGFLKKDWIIILKELGIKNFVIKRKWAFRWLVVIFNE